MTESKGIRTRVALNFVDNLPRSITQWARYLKLSGAGGLRARVERSGSLEQAVKDRLAGVNQPFSVRLTKGVCKRGHKIEGENILLMLWRGKRMPRCRKCYFRGKQIPVGMPRPKAGKKEKARCAAGLHQWTDDNIIWKVSANGKKKRRCRACLNQYQKRRLRNLKMGTWEEPTIKRGQTVDERIAALSQRMPNGCVIWKGKTAGKGIPYVNHKDFAPASGRTVTAYLWEKTHGPLADGIAVRASCGDVLCIAEGQLVARPFSDFNATREVIERRVIARRRNFQRRLLPREIEQGLAPRDYAAEALAAIPKLRAALSKFRRKLTEADREDVIAESIMSMLKKARETAIDDVRYFLLSVCRNAAIDLMRSQWSRGATFTDDFDELQGSGRIRWTLYAEHHGDPSLILEQAEDEFIDRRALRNRFNQLTDAPRRAYLLRAEGLSNKEVAARLGCAEHTVERNLQKAFDFLRTTPTGRERRALLVPLDTERHSYGIGVRNVALTE
jgi:RNA polymerase sigma factor (sigma-70 family)